MTIVSLVLLSAPDAAKYLGISTRKIDDLVEPKGPIPCYRLGKRLTRASALTRYATLGRVRDDQQRGNLYEVEAVLGHRSSQSTKRYAHLATDTLATAIGLIGRKSRTGKK